MQISSGSLTSRFRYVLHLILLKTKLAKVDGSFAGEYRHLKELVDKLNLPLGSVLDIAASDGYSQSSTLGFYRNGWGGLAVEMDPVKFSTLSYLYADFPKVRLAKNRVTPHNVVNMLEAFEIRDIAVLNLDIDSYDLSVIEAMLSKGYLPQIISMEINEKIPPGVYFSVNFSEGLFWQGDHFYGCSLDAAAHTAKAYGYYLVSVEFNNAFFVRNDIVGNAFEDLSVYEAYNSGYRYKPNRQALFPWNADVENWIDSTPEQALNLIKEYFGKYDGLYTLALTSELDV